MYTKEKIVELLRSDQEYYNGIGNKMLSCSSINHIIHNMTLVKPPHHISKELLYGELVHKAILEPEKVGEIPVAPWKTRSGKGYQEFLDNRGIELALTLNDQDRALESVNALLKEYEPYIYDKDCIFEEPAVGRVMGLPFKAKADILNKSLSTIIDIKTTGNLEGFNQSVWKFNYDCQAYVYKELFGVDNFVFMIVDKRNYNVGTYRPTKWDLERARHKISVLKQTYNHLKQ